MLPVRIGYALYNIPMHIFKETPRASDLHKRARQVNHPKKTAFSSANTGFTSVAKQVNHPKKSGCFLYIGNYFSVLSSAEEEKNIGNKELFFSILGEQEILYSPSVLFKINA